MKFDMHCHTKEGSVDGKVPMTQVAAILKSKGFHGMLVSDHNSYTGYGVWEKHKKMMEKNPSSFIVLKGIEYDTIDAGHILVIMPTGVHMRILELRGLPVRLLIDIVHRNGGILGPAHPCGTKYVSITNTRKHKRQLEVMDKFDFVEGFNACESLESNRNAAKLAKKFQKPMFGGSDAHKADCIGLAYTEFTEVIRNESDLIAYIKNGGRVSCGGSYYRGTTKEKLGSANRILVQAFHIYNFVGSLWHRRKRNKEIGKY